MILFWCHYETCEMITSLVVSVSQVFVMIYNFISIFWLLTLIHAFVFPTQITTTYIINQDDRNNYISQNHCRKSLLVNRHNVEDTLGLDAYALSYFFQHFGFSCQLDSPVSPILWIIHQNASALIHKFKSSVLVQWQGGQIHHHWNNCSCSMQQSDKWELRGTWRSDPPNWLGQ